MSRPEKEKTYLTLTETAVKLGTTAARVLMLIKNSQLQGEETDGQWLVESSSLKSCDIQGIGTIAAGNCAGHCSAKDCGCA